MPLDEAMQANFDALHAQIHDAIMADHEARWMQTVGGFSGRRMPELRIPHHPATQSTNIRPPIPRSSGRAVGAQRRRFALLV